MTFQRVTAVLVISFLTLFTSAPAAAVELPQAAVTHVPACIAGPADYARCHARVVTNIKNFATTSPTGISPQTLKAVYGWSTSSTAGAGQTIAIVDAFDDPTAESDLSVFS